MEPLTEAALRFHRDVAGPANEIGTVGGINDLEASRYDLNAWPVAIVLRQASLASLAAGRAP